MAEFDAWAAIYDRVHPGLPGEAEFYIRQAADLHGTVLELGCGTGRIAIPIARSGTPVVGLDISKTMLQRCDAKWRAESAIPSSDSPLLRLVQADMATFELRETFSRIIMPYRSFMHLLRTSEQRKCLDRIAAHLETNGRFILNVWVPSAQYINAFSVHRANQEFTLIANLQDEDTGEALEHYHTVRCKELTQQMIEEHLFVSKDVQGQEVERKVLPLVRTWIGVREMHNLIAASPLEVVEVLGNFDGSPLQPDSTESIWILKRREV